ncbi:hypothetical protein L914_15979 [Phytophthora nicotianae]|uniref:Integrase zinc-binding domain-containing protein n=1 Tax=Phytophthora nicotianae TaxID=4792 RepID=W2MMD3_PHYNI|nr:hypothetical protein L914_15979 [Phytophthora nicotianae]
MIECLEHELSSDGVRPLERLVTAVKDFPRPVDAVEVTRFVHLAGYYRRFIDGFGFLMAPMTKLLRKNAPWEWTAAQQSAFEHVKAVLTTKPLLIYPNFALPFRLTLLYGRKFTIVTDPRSVEVVDVQPELDWKVAPVGVNTSGFEFDVEYRPSSTNVVADALSRAPRTASRMCRYRPRKLVVLGLVTMVTVSTKPKSVTSDLSNDTYGSTCQVSATRTPRRRVTLRQDGRDGRSGQRWQKSERRHRWQRARWVKARNNVLEGRRVLLPPEPWPIVFKECHDLVWAGHLRVPHTYERIAQLYWWPDLQREVKRWVRGCQDCGSRKAKPREVIPPLGSIRGGKVGDRWALDVAGILPVAGSGQRYVIAAVEYVTRYAFGVFRELLTDGAPELTGQVIERLVVLLQTQQINPTDAQDDWATWISFAVYAYNSGRHSTVALSPNELRMGRKLRSPNEQRRDVTER